MIGVTHIGTVTAQGTEEERREMLRAMGAGLSYPDTQEVERLRAESEGAMMIIAQERAENLNLQARVAELEAALAAAQSKDGGS